ncbi:MAG: chemotaxis protein [Sulfurimonas sp. RIFCSPLOWO2_12_FULL_36_74]|uniref:chemotaxis protein n=1 Tax=unclassified Sulfurimonas TaxID=2623549 RepID=UPI0008BB8933|nr:MULTISPECIES: chemotaxis protein [unclassified Sulfurimonas]OHD96925.1 MAG: chemotaxis protein [Sulfurimonas sp. RIFCSPLOWO2_02_FULL_36_28]OHE02161.1 MAG: chemotaxis protein [Sulfurimonas sp. RIFCSPLOWO2_12_36_12]OHE08614.1 MAG: chemotaxis protein [Sulfurimonas sp. RIFCSPLOWO2_12_FULL_36_74]
MTQEELDALMSGDIEDLETFADDEISSQSDKSNDDLEDFEEEVKPSKDDEPLGYSKETAHHWPLPATNENKMVHQLDDVTKESEEKASEIFDIIENISNELMAKEETAKNIIEVLKSNIKLFKTLSEKFSDVEAFKVHLEKNATALDETEQALETLRSSGDAIMSVMDIMQYQDIHRQKIERVINVMRALSNYMNSLFEGRIDDEKRVSSAQHIVGDTHNDLASNEDIEALLAQFGK